MLERGLVAELKPFCRLALKISEQLQHEEVYREASRKAVRESQSYLGIATAETNEHSASMIHKQKWLEMLLERKDKDGDPVEDHELGIAYNEMGVAYGNNNSFDTATVAFHCSIDIFKRLEDYEDTMLTLPEPNLAFIYWMQGRFEDAEKLLRNSLTIQENHFGIDDTSSFL